MKKIPTILFGFISIIIITFSATNSEIISHSSDHFQNDLSKPALSYTPRGPIYISGDGQFSSANGVTSGTGTEIDPFIIEGWNITTFGVAVDIKATNQYFIIRNCWIHSYDNFGIKLGNACQNGTIANNSLISGYTYSIFSSYAKNIKIVNNTINATDNGILLWGSNITTANNTINEGYKGIWIDQESTQCDIFDNNLVSSTIGINIAGNNNTLINNHIENCGTGIQVYADNNTITNNTIINSNEIGIDLYYFTNSSIIGNKLFGCEFNLDVDLSTKSSMMDIRDNLVDNLPFGWFYKLNNSIVDGNYAQIVLYNCINITIQNQNISDYLFGIFIINSPNSNLRNNYLASTDHAVYVVDSPNTIIINNDIINAKSVGINVYSQDCLISNNSIISQSNGASSNKGILNLGQNNTFYQNFIQQYEYGLVNDVLIEKSGKDSVVSENIFHKNRKFGLLTNSDNGIFYKNYFLDNNQGDAQASDNGQSNKWINDSSQVGNWWSDYLGSGNYTINGTVQNNDTFPLILSYSISQPNDVLFDNAVTGNIIEWFLSSKFPITKNTPINYTIYRNGTKINQGQRGISDIQQSVDGLSYGQYNISVYTIDFFGNTANDSVFVTVRDLANPIIINPFDVTYSEGSHNNIITWTAMDNNPGIYYVFRNGTQISTNTWVSGVPITQNIDGLSVGVYNYTIIILDQFNNLNSDTVLVFVEDNTSPTLTNPNDFTYFKGDQGNNITWLVNDLNPSYYIIYQNGTQIQNGTWISSNPITIVIDNLTIGNYNYTIIVFDQYNNWFSDTVLISVIERTNTSSIPTTSSTTTLTPPDKELSSGQIVGIVISVISGVLGVGFGVIWIMKKKNIHLFSRKYQQSATQLRDNKLESKSNQKSLDSTDKSQEKVDKN
jgi:parallel beta-helix repeat protein